MTRSQKVLWTEGLFLTPHHFQQWDRYHEELLWTRLRSMSPFGWGAEELEFNTEALDNGVFEVLRCRAVLPDGLVVSVPDGDQPPPRREFQSHFPPTEDRLPVFLGIPLLRPSAPNLSGEGAESMARYSEGRVQVPDENTGENSQPVTVAAKNLRILFGEGSLDNHVALKIAELRRTPDGKTILDEQFIPPAVSISASRVLVDIVRRLLEMLTSKNSVLAGQRRQKSSGVADFTTSDVASFWLLHTVNSYLPTMMHYRHVQRAHPEQLYLTMARLAAELTTFVVEGGPTDLPLYMHTDLTQTFGELDRRLRILLETVIPTRCVPIPLERTRESLYVGRITDDRILTHAEFYLGVWARLPEAQLIERVPGKAKISSMDTINYLLGQALRGVTLQLVPTPPGPLPTRAGFRYFRLLREGSHWDSVVSSRNICIFFPADFQDLRLELYAIKD